MLQKCILDVHVEFHTNANIKTGNSGNSDVTVRDHITRCQTSADCQTEPTDLGSGSACRLLSSALTVTISITQPES